MMHKDMSEKIIGAAFEVHNQLGPGFLEKVYENALALELKIVGLRVQPQLPIPVHYKGQVVGEYYADLLVEDVLVCEIKAVERLANAHEVQLVHYLAATRKDVGLLINFGSSVTVKRKFPSYKLKSR